MVIAVAQACAGPFSGASSHAAGPGPGPGPGVQAARVQAQRRSRETLAVIIHRFARASVLLRPPTRGWQPGPPKHARSVPAAAGDVGTAIDLVAGSAAHIARPERGCLRGAELALSLWH